jgi:hypothetical protein
MTVEIVGDHTGIVKEILVRRARQVCNEYGNKQTYKQQKKELTVPTFCILKNLEVLQNVAK